MDASLRYLPRVSNLRDLSVEDNVKKTSFPISQPYKWLLRLMDSINVLTRPAHRRAG